MRDEAAELDAPRVGNQEGDSGERSADADADRPGADADADRPGETRQRHTTRDAHWRPARLTGDRPG
jgi:hypothetical protein